MITNSMIKFKSKTSLECYLCIVVDNLGNYESLAGYDMISEVGL